MGVFTWNYKYLVKIFTKNSDSEPDPELEKNCPANIDDLKGFPNISNSKLVRTYYEQAEM
jgi:hypothetical protein